MYIFLLVVFLCFLHISLIVPGYALVRATKFFKTYPAVELCAGYLVTLFVLALTATAGYILGIPQTILQIILATLLTTGLVFFVIKKQYRELIQFRFILGCFFLMSLFSILFVQLSLKPPYQIIPDPTPVSGSNYTVFDVKILNIAQTNANDNSIPYRQAQFMNNRSDPAEDSFIDEWGVTFFQRTPLMGAVSAAYFTLLNQELPIAYIWSNTSPDPSHTYLQFQVISSVLNALFIVPAYFLITRMFNKKAAQLSVLFMIPSQYFLYNAFFSWPKSLVAFFILFSWLLILEKRFRFLLLAGVASGMAYLTHDLAVLYLCASLLLLLYFKRFRDTFVFLGVNILFAAPWFITSSLIYKKPSTFIYYPFSTTGIPQYEQRHQVLRQFRETSILKLIVIRLETLAYLLSPYQLFTSEGGQKPLHRLWALGIFSIPGSIGIGLFPAAIIGFFRRRNIPLWIMVFTPVLACAAVIGWKQGLGSMHFAQAVVVLLVGLACWFLNGLKHKIWLWLAVVGNTLQLCLFTLYSFNYQWREWFTNPRDICVLLMLVGIVGISILLIYRVATKKRLYFLPSVPPFKS